MSEEINVNNEISLTELLASFKKRERDFIFNVRAGFKHGEAARAAGFPDKSADTQASRLMQRDDVQLVLKKLYEQDCKSLCITKESIIVRANEMYMRCMQSTPVMEFNRATGEYEATGEYQFDSRGAGKALEIICKVSGFEKQELDVKTAPAVINFTVTDSDENKSEHK